MKNGFLHCFCHWRRMPVVCPANFGGVWVAFRIPISWLLIYTCIYINIYILWLYFARYIYFLYRVDFIEFWNCSDVHICGDGNIAIPRIWSRQIPRIIVSKIIIEWFYCFSIVFHRAPTLSPDYRISYIFGNEHNTTAPHNIVTYKSHAIL